MQSIIRGRQFGQLRTRTSQLYPGRTTVSEAMLGQSGQTHSRRDVFVDHWRVEDASNADARQATDAPEPDVMNGSEATAGEVGGSEDIYEWVPDGRFLLHRRNAGHGEVASGDTEVLEYQPVRADYFTRFFDDSGNCTESTALVDGNILMFKAANTCATVAVTDDGKTLDITCEWREDGSDWSPILGLLARCG
jgi:hypothetical protein